MTGKTGKRIHFSKTTIAGLPIPASGARATYYDDDVPKLALRITAAGVRSFYAVKRAASGMEWVKLGTFPELTVENARKEATVEAGNIASGLPTRAKRKREYQAAMSLGEAFEQYVNRYAIPHGVKGIDAMRAIWERCIGEMPDLPAKKRGVKRTKHPAGVNWQNRKLESIKSPEVRALHAAIGATTPPLANKVISILSTVFNRATEWGYKGGNPVTGVKDFTESERDRFMQIEEFPKFIAALESETNEAFKAFVLLSLLTGARRGNVLAMKWEQISLSRAVWRIPAKTSKNGAVMTIPLTAEAIAILEERAKVTAGSAFVFPSSSASGHMTPPKAKWTALCKRAGIADLTLHDLRRTLASYQAITGASTAVIGKTLGHKSQASTAIYARLSMDPVRQSVNAATAAMMTAAGLKPAAEVVELPKRGAA